MVRLILIAVAIFCAIYLLSRRFNASQQGNDVEGNVVSPRSGGFPMVVIAVIAVLSLIFILPRLGVSLLACFKKLWLYFRSFVRFYRSRFSLNAVIAVCSSK